VVWSSGSGVAGATFALVVFGLAGVIADTPAAWAVLSAVLLVAWALWSLGGLMAMMLGARLTGFDVTTVRLGLPPCWSIRTRSRTVEIGWPAGWGIVFTSRVDRALPTRARWMDGVTVLGAILVAFVPLTLPLPRDWAWAAVGTVAVGLLAMFRRPPLATSGGSGWHLLAGRPNRQFLHASARERDLRCRLTELDRPEDALTEAASLPRSFALDLARATCLAMLGREPEATVLLRTVDVSGLDLDSRLWLDNLWLTCLCNSAERDPDRVGWTAQGWAHCDRLRSVPRWDTNVYVCCTVAQFLTLADHPDQGYELTQRRATRSLPDALITRALALERLGHHDDAVATLGAVQFIGPQEPRLAAVRALVLDESEHRDEPA
jgi:hypothetical protein